MDNKYPSAAADAQDASASVAESPSADLAILQKELAAQKDEYLRLAAHFDNFKSAPGAIPSNKPRPKRSPSSAICCPFSTISNAPWPPSNLFPLTNYIKAWK